MSEDQNKNIKQLLDSGYSYLDKLGIQQGRLICELLLSRLLKCKRLELCLRYEEELPERLLKALRRGMKRVAAREPVQYVLGETEFMGHLIKVDSRVLIPRPETEVLVSHVLDCQELWRNERPAVVDVGTGSGCIVISLAMARSSGVFVGLDLSPEALELARENAAHHGVSERVFFAQGELCDVVDPASCDAIISNPPYISIDDYQKLDSTVRDFEPEIALVGGNTGLEVLDSIVQDASMALKPGGRLFLEIGEEQAKRVCATLSDLGFDQISVDPDLTGRDRVVSAILQE